MNSLQGYYYSWSSLTVDDKITLLKQTEKKIENESVENVAHFCLYILSQISLENECTLYPDLKEPVKSLRLRVQSKSITCSEQEYVGYLVNKKNPYLLVGPGAIRDSLAISESRNVSIKMDPAISQETCMIILTLFRLNHHEQARSLQDVTSKEYKEIIKASICFKFQGSLKKEIDKITLIYLQDKKLKKLLNKIETFVGEEQLAAIFRDYLALNGNTKDSRPLLEAIERQYSHQEAAQLNEDAKAMLSWYLFQTRQESFSPHSTLKGNNSLCFAHYLLVKAECAKYPTDISLSIKKAYLSLLIHKNENVVLPNLNEILFFYSKDEIEAIFEAIESVFSFMPACESLRKQLVEIIQSIPKYYRELYTNDLLSTDYYLSDSDPLFLFMLKESEETGFGWERTHLICSNGGVEYAIKFLKKLECIHPKTILKFAKNLIFWASENEVEKNEDLLLFQYALSVTPDFEFLSMISQYMTDVIFSRKFDINTFYPTLETFLEKIKYFRGVCNFLHPLCEYAVTNNAFLLGIQLAAWDKKIDAMYIINSDPLNEIFFLAKSAKPEEIAELYIKRQLDIETLESSFVDLLERSNCLVLSLDDSYSILEKALLNLALSLCKDENFSKVIELNKAIEDSSNVSILFPLLSHFSNFDETSYKILFDSLFKTHSTDELVQLCLASKKFNSFHKHLIKRLLASIPITLTNSISCHPIYKNAEIASSLEIARFLTAKKFSSNASDEKIRLMSFFVRTNYLISSEKEYFNFLQKGVIAVAMRLWDDKHYDELVTFLEYFEDGNFLILRPFLIKMSQQSIHDENFERVFNLIYKYDYEDFILPYLHVCKSFTPYHIQLMNKIKANSVLTKKPF